MVIFAVSGPTGSQRLTHGPGRGTHHLATGELQPGMPHDRLENVALIQRQPPNFDVTMPLGSLTGGRGAIAMLMDIVHRITTILHNSGRLFYRLLETQPILFEKLAGSRSST